MGFQFSLCIIIMLSAAIICFIIGCLVQRHRNTHVDTLIIFIMMMSITEWLIASALGYATTEPSSKILWAKIEYIGVVTTPLLVLIFSTAYSGFKHLLTQRNLILIALIPAITLLLAFTNDIHGFIWSSYIPYLENNVMFSTKVYGIGFWIYWTYSYLLLLSATILIIRVVLTSNTIFRGQMIILVLGILIPWMGNALYVLHISPLGNLDLTPLSFALTGIMLSIGVIKWHLFDIKPTAHVAVFENMDNGLIVLDKFNHVIDINPYARSMFKISTSEIIGKHGSQILPGEVFSNALSDSKSKMQQQVKLIINGKERYYELTISQFNDKYGEPIGKICIIHDITELELMHVQLIAAERKISEQQISESEKKYLALFDNANDAIIIVDTNTGIIIDANKEAETLLGRKRDDIINLPRSMIHPGSKTNYYDEHFKKHLTEGRIIDFDAEIIRKDGVIIPVSISASTMKLQGKSVIQGIFRDMTKRIKVEEALREGQEKLMSALYQTIESMAMMTTVRDPFTAQHQQHVSSLSVQIALEMGLSEHQIKALEMAALIHDIGKMRIPADILSKPGKLNNIEYELIKTHVQAGFDILKPIEFPWPITSIILQHHERENGSGYPKGLNGKDICIEAKILAVADVVEAMASHRPYRPALGEGPALEEIMHNKGILYDEKVVEACVKLFYEKKFRFAN
jgi:PAS domain S-box-containing protein/putative nucleotidyltransferase with HDIG domain